MSPEAGGLRCPSCGAPAAPTDAACAYCKASLHAVRCPWCFQWTFSETRDCPRCGASTAEIPAGPAPKACPSCRKPGLTARRMGGAVLWGCALCSGVWADADSFKRICEDRAVQAVYLGKGTPLAGPARTSDPSDDKIVYRPCAVCGELMNRFNFAHSSGVILDTCRPHGVWFDADELRRIVAFIAGGGLDAEREREKTELEETRRKLDKQLHDRSFTLVSYDPLKPGQPPHILSAASLLEHIFGLE